jgi:hypothetical protein
MRHIRAQSLTGSHEADLLKPQFRQVAVQPVERCLDRVVQSTLLRGIRSPSGAQKDQLSLWGKRPSLFHQPMQILSASRMLLAPEDGVDCNPHLFVSQIAGLDDSIHFA